MALLQPSRLSHCITATSALLWGLRSPSGPARRKADREVLLRRFLGVVQKWQTPNRPLPAPRGGRRRRRRGRIQSRRVRLFEVAEDGVDLALGGLDLDGRGEAGGAGDGAEAARPDEGEAGLGHQTLRDATMRMRDMTLHGTEEGS